MKSDHRHELKTNELARWLSNFPQWARGNLRMIIYVSIVAVLVIVAAFFHWYRKNIESVQKQLKLTRLITQLPLSKMQIVAAQAQGVDISYMLIQTADNLQAATQNTKDDQMAALALIKRAESLRAELHYHQGTVSRTELEAAINQAKAGYSEALEKASPNPSLMATAKFGLGLCEEELGNFEKAEQIYSDITTNADFESTVAAAAAKQRLETMADYQRKVVFKVSPKPVPTKTKSIQPQIQLKPADTNLPGRESGETVKQ